MNEVVCRGLDGANPLHALAAFGLLRLATRIWPGTARLGWGLADGTWRPRCILGDAWPQVIAHTLNRLGRIGQTDPLLNRAVNTAAAAQKKLVEQRKPALQQARAMAKERGLRGGEAKDFVSQAVRQLDSQIDVKQRELDTARTLLAQANGHGIAHLGDIIGVTPDIFRASAELSLARPHVASDEPDTGDPDLILSQLAALACDQVTESSRLVPSPYSFSNGSSGQCLLKDFRACAVASTPEFCGSSLLGTGDPHVAGMTGLNWDPADNRDYALRWDDPASATKHTDVVMNALAYLGLSLLPCMPSTRGLQAVGWRQKTFTWPIWEPLLSLPVASSVLAHFGLQAENPGKTISAMGIAEVRRCAVINPTGKRNFFAPSRPV